MGDRHKMPLPSRAQALRLGAGFLENDLDEMRTRAVAHWESVQREGRGDPMPLSTSHEADLMRAAELASAAATLRAMAEAGDD